MGTNGDAEQMADSIITEALKAAGVPPREINVEAVGEPTKPNESGQPPIPRKTKMDGSLKGYIKGDPGEPVPEGEDTGEGETETTPEPKPAEPALTKAEIAELLSQTTTRMQSMIDKKIGQITQQMNGTINALNQFFESQEDASFTGLPPEEQVMKRIERLEKGGKQPRIQVSQPIPEQAVNFVQYLANFVDAVGLKIDDKRIDWAPDATDPQIGFSRFAKSIKTALVDDQAKAIKGLKEDGEREISKIRKKVGVDKVSTTGAGGAGLPDVDKMTPFEQLEYGFKQEEIARKT